MRILVITNTIPYPQISGGRIRVYNLVKRIARHHEVWLGCHLHSADEIEGVPHLRQFCADVATGLLQHKSALSHVPGLLRYLAAGRPPEFKFLHSDDLAQTLAAWCREIPFDAVHIDESRMALYLEALPPMPRAARLLTLHNVEFDQAARIAQIEGDALSRFRSRLHNAIMRRWEPRYSERFDRCIVVSETDRERLASRNGRLRIDVVPNGVDTTVYQPLGPTHQDPALLFIGNMSYRPCVDAAVYLVRDILPLVRRRHPDTEVWLVGAGPTAEVQALADPGVHVTGRVEDVVPYYARCAAAVVPLRAGGGTRLKILEAMALGRPVVSTTIGCEGLEVEPGEHLLVADDPQHLAEAIVGLLDDPARGERLVVKARQLVSSRYDWDAIADQMLGVYDAAVAAHRAENPLRPSAIAGN